MTNTSSNTVILHYDAGSHLTLILKQVRSGFSNKPDAGASLQLVPNNDVYEESEPLEVFKTSKGFNYRCDLAMHYEASPMLNVKTMVNMLGRSGGWVKKPASWC